MRRVIFNKRKHTDKSGTFRQSVERQARAIVESSKLEKKAEFSQARVIEHEMALALEHLEQLRANHEKVRESLLTVEVYTDNELMSMEARTPKYSSYRFPEREKLQRRLLAIEHERRALILSEGERNRALHEKLLELVEKHRVLAGVDSSRKSPSRKSGRRPDSYRNQSENGRHKNSADT